MAFPVEGGRVGRSKYWMLFFVNLVAVLVLLFVSIASLVAGEVLTAVLSFLLIAPVGIYFRVVMMRRCRDIGWPPSLPWIVFGLGIVASFYNIGSLGAAGKDAVGALGGFGFAGLVSMADFVLMIVLGCLRGRSEVDYQEVFGGYGSIHPEPSHQRTAPLPDRRAAPIAVPATGQGDAMDDAIARALDNYRRTGAAVPAPGQQDLLRQRTVPTPQARVGGFGRRGVL